MNLSSSLSQVFVTDPGGRTHVLPFDPPIPLPQIRFVVLHSSPSHPLQIYISGLAEKILRLNAHDAKMVSTMNRAWRFCSDAEVE